MSEDASLYVGCGCVVADGDGRYLLVRETKAIARGRLALPAGKLEAGESIPEASMREVAEETGLIVELEGLIGVFHCALTSENSFGVNFVYLASIAGGELTPTDEHPELVWLTLVEIEDLHSQGKVRGTHLVEAVRRAAAGRLLTEPVLTEVPAALT